MPQDKKQEPNDVMLARIDENVKFLKSGAEFVRIQLDNHEKQDDRKFDEINRKFDLINRSIWMVSGGACVLIFILNWIHYK